MIKRRPHIVIVGAGFGGVQLAKELARENIDITIINKENYHLFQPLLYQVATAALSLDEICYPVRSFFRKNENVDFLLAEVTGVNAEEKFLYTSRGEIKYDYLVLAAGSTTNFFGMKKVEENSFPIKTLEEAINLRSHIIEMFELASNEEDHEKRKQLLTFVCVGGGPTGVEMAGALSELIHQVMEDDYPSINFREVEIKLVEAMNGLLLSMPKPLQEETASVLRQRCRVEVMLGAQVSDYDGEILQLKDGTEIQTKTVIWAAGVKAVPFVSTFGAKTDRAGRVFVNEYLQVEGFKEIFAIGDCAHFEDEGQPLPTIATVAIQEAKVCAENLMRLVNQHNEPWTKFSYKDIGSMATISRGQAVASMGNVQLTGFLAWLMWMAVHLIRLAGTYTNVIVLWKWSVNFFTSSRLDRIILNTIGQRSKKMEGKT